jgi:class 3 adenylate cyclase
MLGMRLTPSDNSARSIAVVVALWRLGRAMLDLPRGTVTFLFTDIEGSTRLLAALGDAYADLLAAHQRVVRKAVGAHSGCEVSTQGDAFFVAFARARDAMGAAVAAQRGLATVPAPDGVTLRVRMGLHTGEAAVRGTTYVGLDVHRAARICSAAHGGQVLVSSTTRELVTDALPEQAVALRDLGLFSLRDLARPERLFEIVADDLPAGERDIAA